LGSARRSRGLIFFWGFLERAPHISQLAKPTGFGSSQFSQLSVCGGV
jgi:hypothetical protein